MTKLNEEYFKQKVGWYRHLFTIFTAINIGCVAWFISNFDNAHKEFLILDLTAVLISVAILGIVSNKVIKYIKLLRE